MPIHLPAVVTNSIRTLGPEFVDGLKNKTRSQLGVTIATLAWSVVFKFASLPVAISGVIALCLYICWVHSRSYDKDVINTALYYFLGAIGFEESQLDPSTPIVRCCLYVPVGFEQLQMVSDYIPEAGRSAYAAHFKRLSISKGTVGQAYRRKQTIVDLEPMDYTTAAEFDRHFSNLGFTTDDITFLSKDWKTVCAVPLLRPAVPPQKDQCFAVLYFATNETDLLQDQRFLDKMESAAMLMEPLLRLMKR